MWWAKCKLYKDFLLGKICVLQRSTVYLPMMNIISNIWKGKALVTQSCTTLCDPMDCSPPASSVHGILQERILDLVNIFSSKWSFPPRDRTQVSWIFRWIRYHLSHQRSPREKLRDVKRKDQRRWKQRLEWCAYEPTTAGSPQKLEARPGMKSLEPPVGTNPANTLPLGICPPELRGNKFLLF